MSFVHSQPHTIEDLEAHVNAPMLDETMGLLRSLWKHNSGGIVHYAETRNPTTKSDVDPAENPLLTRAIEEIRDGYFTIGNKMKNLDVIRPHHLLRSLIAPRKEKAIQQPFDTVEREINDAAIVHNAASLERLMAPRYGFSPEEAAGILKGAGKAGAEPPAPMDVHEAYKLLGKVIGRSLSCYEEMTEYRPMIPQVFRRNSGDAPQR